MSKLVKLSDVKRTLLEMSKERTRSVGWGDVLMERLKDISIEVSEDCISREWLISFIDVGHLRNPNEKCYSENDVVELIKNAPSVVVRNNRTTAEQSSIVDIVTCEECRHTTYTVKSRATHETFYACPYSCINHEGKFFCSYGERIDNE